MAGLYSGKTGLVVSSCTAAGLAILHCSRLTLESFTGHSMHCLLGGDVWG